MAHETLPPNDGDEPDASRGHETSDVAARPIVFFLIGLVVFGGITQLAMTLLMRGYVAQDTKIATLPVEVLRDQGDVLRPPALQRDTTADMLAMYKGEDEILNTYYMDPKTREIRVPMSRAIEIVARKGLPTRPDAPKMTGVKKLPYPSRSKAYMATP